MTIGKILAYIIAALTTAGCIVLICGALSGLITTIREPKHRRDK